MDLETAVGFAFANADVLVEISNDFRVALVAGACVALLGAREDALVTSDIRDLVRRSDRTLLEGLILTLPPGGRFRARPMVVTRPDRRQTAVNVSGFRSGHRTSHVCIALTLRNETPEDDVAEAPRDETTGLLSPDAFIAELGQATQDAVDRELTLFEFEGLAALRARLGEQAVSDVLERIGGILRVHAANDVAGYLDHGRFGILHEKAVSAASLEGEISRLSGRAPEELGVKTVSFDQQDAKLGHEDMNRVMRFVVQRFTDGNPDVFGWTEASQVVDRMVAATLGEMGQLREMLRDRAAVVLYQPIVSLANEELHHYEALTRFRDMHTGEAVKFAEDTGVIYDLDLYVCETVLEQLERQPQESHVSVALNLSAHSLVSDVFIGSFRELMASRGALRSQVLIELTETVEIKDFDRAAAVLRQLRKDGHPVCIDDFGVGATSFHYVRAFDVDYLKIDGMYVESVGQDPKTDSIVKALIDVGHRSNISVIAERVETRRQANTLRELGCDLGQGFLYAKPLAEMTYVPPAREAAPNRRKGAKAEWA